MKQKLGFSLAEMMVVLFLFGAIMGAVGSIMTSAYRVVNVNQAKDNAYLNGVNALERISSEVREALSFSSTGSTLTFRKVNNALDPANGQAPNAGTIVAPYAVGDQVQVSYAHIGDDLIRTVNGGQATVFVTKVTGFNANVTGASVTISLSVSTRTRIIPFDTEFLWPAAL